MKNKRLSFKVSTRAVLLSGLLAASVFMLTACGETQKKETPADTVTATPPPPPVDTTMHKDTTKPDTGRVITDPKKP